jgi:hypothetical protein
MSTTTHKTIRVLIAIWFAVEIYLLVIGLWTFRGPQTIIVDGAIHHRYAERFELGVTSAAVAGIFLPMVAAWFLATLGIEIPRSNDVPGYVVGWIVICGCGLVQWYLILRGSQLAIRKVKVWSKQQSA